MSGRGFFRRNWFCVAAATYGFTSSVMGFGITDAIWWLGMVFGCVAYIGANVDAT